MYFKNLWTAFLLGFLATNAVARLNPGTYFIVNRVMAPRGPPLALTLSGTNSPAVISAKTSSLTQQWIVADLTPGAAYQAILSASDRTLEGGLVGNTLTTLPAASQVWDIGQTPDGYYEIKNPGGSAKWGIKSTNQGSSVVLGTVLGQRGEWIIEAI